jgi:hypothetical protein
MVYKIAAGYTKNHPRRVVVVSCFKYESVSRRMLQGFSLEYVDERFYNNEVSDEL